MFAWLNTLIRSIIMKKAAQHRAVDIVEVRTKQLGLLSVKTETFIQITNSFFLPIFLVSIHTKLTNEEGIVVGKMSYDDNRKIKGKSSIVIATHSEISIISSIFHAINNLLSQPIYMRSVGTAVIKVLWWDITLPVDDEFRIMPNQLKILGDETEEERQLRKERHLKFKEERDKRVAMRKAKYAERKEERLKRKYGDAYIPKAMREQELTQETYNDDTPMIVDEEIKVVWDEQAIAKVALQEDISDEKTTSITNTSEDSIA